MNKFSDQLFTDLMNEHGPALAGTVLTGTRQRHPVRRAALLAGGAGTLAVALTAGLTLTGGGASPAYAVTKNPDGTLTIAVSSPSGIAGANATLHAMGEHVYLVPVKAGCPSIDSLPQPVYPDNAQVSMSIASDANGSITVDASGVPAGAIVVVAVDETSTQGEMSGGVTLPPPPSCVTLPPISDTPTSGSETVTAPPMPTNGSETLTAPPPSDLPTSGYSSQSLPAPATLTAPAPTTSGSR
jgi:hypothetical protein